MRSSARSGGLNQFLYVDRDDELVEYEGPEEIDEQEISQSDDDGNNSAVVVHNGNSDDKSFSEQLNRLTKSLDVQLNNQSFDFVDEHEEEDEKLVFRDNFEKQKETSEIHDFKENFSLDSFREELDILTRSLDNGINVDELINEAQKQISSSRPKKKDVSTSDSFLQQLPAGGDHHKNVSFSEDTQEVYMRTQQGTPNRRQNNRQSFATPTRSVSENPPTPVKTPGLVNDAYISSPPPPADSRSVSSVETLLDRMRDTIERQDRHIRQLEQENQELKYRLRRLRTPDGRLNDDTPFFSPGTKFVAELARSIDLPEHQYGELARIMDKHYERVSEIRRRHGWD